MADGRHFENSIISISQPEIIRFQSNLVRGCLFPFGEWIFEKEIEIFQIQMADRGHIESRFLPISRRHIGRFMRISEWR